MSYIILYVFFLLYRVFSRIAVIPFNRVDPKQFGEVHDIRNETPCRKRAIESIGTILDLGIVFASMHSDPLFEEVFEMSNQLSDQDMRAQFNYSLLLFSTGKVC